MNQHHWKNFWRKSLEKTPRWQMFNTPGNYSQLKKEKTKRSAEASTVLLKETETVHVI